MNTKIWLIIIASMHTLMGVLVPLLQFGNMENLGVFLYFFVISIHLFYAILFTKDQNQNRLAIVLCIPVIFWFIASAIMNLEMYGFPIAAMPDALMPIIFWSMPVISGIYNLNYNKKLQTTYNQIQEKVSKMEKEFGEIFLTYPIPKAIVEEWEKVSKVKN